MTEQLLSTRQSVLRVHGRGLPWRAVLASTSLAALVLLLAMPVPARAAAFVVINTNDSGAGSLRAAILMANSTANVGGPDVISFAIPGTGVKTITPLTALPGITDPVSIDGYTQPGASPNTLSVGDNAVLLIAIDGSSAPDQTTGLTIASGDTTVRGLSIYGFGDVTDVGIPAVFANDIGIRIVAGANNTDNIIAGNFIGIKPDGVRQTALNSFGLIVGSDDNQIGGTSPGDRNVITLAIAGTVILDGTTAAPVTGNRLQGNYIGTNVQGTATYVISNFPNTRALVSLLDASDNVIGGTAPGAGNVLAGHAAGIELASDSTNRTGPSSGNLIQGNHIGLNAMGTAALGTAGDGVNVNFGTNNTIGGTVAGARNVISGNAGDGISIDSTGNRVQGNYIGTNASGTVALPNRRGVYVTEADNVIGGATAGARNVLSGNSTDGVEVGGTASGVLVQGNYIGTNAVGDAALGNGEFGVTVGAAGVTIGGTSPGARNVISGSGLDGVALSRGAIVQGNYIGTNAVGDAALPNQRNGVLVSTNTSGTLIGGTTTSARNVISGNDAEGVRMFGTGSAVQGNYIGTNAAGTGALGNGEEGVYISFGGSDNTVGGSAAGAGNVIAFNGGAGVAIQFIEGFDPVTGNKVSRNSIHSNDGLGIDLENDGPTANDACDGDDGANGRQNAPEIYSVTAGAGGTTDIRVRLDSAPNQTYTVEFFSTPIESPTAFLEAKTFMGTANLAVGPSCIFDGVINLPGTVPPGHWVTATAEGTSELVPPPALRIDDVSQVEGDSGATAFTFTASLSAPWHSTLTVDYRTTNSTAVSPSDYTATSGTLTFAQGDTAETITVQVNGDTTVEPDERFFLDLSDFSLGADAIEDGRGRGTITNDDSDGGGGDPPALAIDNVTGMEGDSGTTPFRFTVTRTGDTSGASSVRYHTEDGTAETPQDYVAISDATLSFAAGQTSRTLTVQVKGDGKRAPDETFFVVLTEPTNASLGDGRGKGTILYDDPYLSIRDLVIDEPASGYVTARFKVVLSYPTISGVTVHYRTRDGTARAGRDYVAKTDATLRFAAGERVKYATVRVLQNGATEPDETFFVDLFNATGPDGTARIEDPTGRGLIRD